MEKREVVEKALALGFCDIGFTGVEPFNSQAEILKEREHLYNWTLDRGIDLQGGIDPTDSLSGAKTIIVLLENYYQQAFPASMVGKFGRCYLDDDRVTKDGLALRIKQFRGYLRDSGIQSKVPFYLPHRLAAARAGLGSFGKNNLFYANRTARQSSWVFPVTIVVDYAFEPDPAVVEVGCPKWCRNACISACPTGALIGPNKIDPRRCISYLTYYGEGITPLALREPMGMWVYGCDRCQNVCPRNEAWMAQDLPVNLRAEKKASVFDLTALLFMDRDYFKKEVWPHMFYMSSKDIWRWKMNVARVMGNSKDQAYVPHLIKAYQENEDERVLGMIAWALGCLGGPQAQNALRDFSADAVGEVSTEIIQALEAIHSDLS